MIRQQLYKLHRTICIRNSFLLSLYIGRLCLPTGEKSVMIKLLPIAKHNILKKIILMH
jgi:hypothetical protein